MPQPGDAAEGVLSSTTITIDGPQPEARKALIAEYEKRYNQTMDAPTSVFGAYDSIYLLAYVMNRDGFEPDKIRAGLENVASFEGLLLNFKRPVFTKDRHDAITENDMIMTRWTNGKMLEIKYDADGPYVEIDEKTKKRVDKTTLALK
jgi:ABC-type branched-subunit amino acid transport system substrate-binding protein